MRYYLVFYIEKLFIDSYKTRKSVDTIPFKN